MKETNKDEMTVETDNREEETEAMEKEKNCDGCGGGKEQENNI